MAVLFSLTDSYLYMELPAPDPVYLSRRIASVETLEGVQTRDLGGGAGGMEFSLETELTDGDLSTLASAVESGKPLALSLSLKSYSVHIGRVESRRISDGTHEVKIDVTVSREI